MQGKVSLSKLEGIDYLQWEHNQYQYVVRRTLILILYSILSC